MKETVIILQDLFYAHTFERYQLIKRNGAYLTRRIKWADSYRVERVVF